MELFAGRSKAQQQRWRRCPSVWRWLPAPQYLGMCPFASTQARVIFRVRAGPALNLCQGLLGLAAETMRSSGFIGAGMTGIKCLAFLGCWTYVDWPGHGWDRLRQLEQLDMTGGDGAVDDLSDVIPGKTVDICWGPSGCLRPP
jgi:hypothetical protein